MPLAAGLTLLGLYLHANPMPLYFITGLVVIAWWLCVIDRRNCSLCLASDESAARPLSGRDRPAAFFVSSLRTGSRRRGCQLIQIMLDSLEQVGVLLRKGGRP